MKRYFPFTYKMMLSYLVLVLLTDVLIGYFSYTMLVQSRTEAAETNIRMVMEQTRDNVQYQMEEIRRISDTLFGSLPFQRALQMQGEPHDIYLTMMDEIVPQMQSPLQLFGSNIRLILYTRNSNLNMVPASGFDKPITHSDYYILSYNEIRSTDWMQAIQENGLDNVWLQIETDEALSNITFFRKLVSYSDYQTIIGYIRITASLEELLGNFAYPAETGIALRFTDQHSGKQLFARGPSDAPWDSERTLYLAEAIPGTNYVIETLVPHSYLKQDAAKLRGLILLIGTASFLFMAFIGYIVARLNGRKMKRIVTLIRAFQEGNFRKRIHFSGNDEFVQIANAFNLMATNIQQLINSVYVHGIQKKQVELEALQSQINPHFLYNTLSTISSLANMGETAKVTEMVKRLSRFYRLTLNQGQVVITLAKELEQVETYLDIQRVKYADAFEVYTDMEPALLDKPVIKLILQPFVENVFKHAWYGEQLAIRITGRIVKDRIELKVIDNGIGMTKDKVDRLLSGTVQTGSYGLKNVDERIKLRYGEQYGIQIYSIYGGGTTVKIELPLEWHPAEEELQDEGIEMV